MNKMQERFFVEEAARSLRVPWEILEERESPDFIVDDGGCRFGLEISELFAGPVGIGGAIRKAAESFHQKTIDRYRSAYERERTVPLRVAILGKVTRGSMEELLTMLLSHDLEAMRPGERFEVLTSNLFKAHVTRGLRHEWFRVNDRVGWVNTNPLPIIDKAVAKKSKLLPRYREAAGPDIRLLLVANRLFGSGKLQLVNDSIVDTQEFRIVYFFSYPETVTVFCEHKV